MKIKEVKPINFLFFRTRTTLGQLEEFIPVGQRLYKEAVANSLPITGALQWHYHGFNGNASAPFDLEVALPVALLPAEYDGEFHIKRTQPFKCVSAIHDGSWTAIPETYERVLKFIRAHHLKKTAATREVYANVDFEDTSANVTEIQFGIE